MPDLTGFRKKNETYPKNESIYPNTIFGPSRSFKYPPGIAKMPHASQPAAPIDDRTVLDQPNSFSNASVVLRHPGLSICSKAKGSHVTLGGFHTQNPPSISLHLIILTDDLHGNQPRWRNPSSILLNGPVHLLLLLLLHDIFYH